MNDAVLPALQIQGFQNLSVPSGPLEMLVSPCLVASFLAF